MSDMGLHGETREIEALVDADRQGDGVFEGTRAGHAEAELTAAGERFWNKDQAKTTLVYEDFAREVVLPRDRLLHRARTAPSILREWSLTPLDDRMLVKYASHREGYVCTVCDGEGTSDQVCPNCRGEGKIPLNLKGNAFEVCRACKVTGAEGMEPKVTGKMPCEACKGSGLAKGVLAIPDQAKRDHSYGDIVSVGEQVYDLAPGDRVCFSKMAGIHVHNEKADTNKRDTHYCLLRRGEVMGYMRRV